MTTTNISFVTLLAASVFFVPFSSNADETPPAEGGALYDWLAAGNYKDWVQESDKHQSKGPHPVTVIAYLNTLLDDSLAAGSTNHPEGAAAVKELFDDSGKLSGWAVSIKTQVDSDSGQGWYWYEMLGTNKDSRVVADGNGVGLCFGCHTPGSDFVLIPHPLK